MNVGEVPPNWLSDIIRECRKIDRLLPVIERRAERDCIVTKIKQHAKGTELRAKSSLESVVEGALAVANSVEREMKRNPHLGPSPEAAAARHIADEYGMVLD